MNKGYYTVECNNCIFITYYKGRMFIEEDEKLANFLKKYPVKIIRCIREC